MGGGVCRVERRARYVGRRRLGSTLGGLVRRSGADQGTSVIGNARVEKPHLSSGAMEDDIPEVQRLHAKLGCRMGE